MSGTLVYDLDYFQQVIISYSGFLNLSAYANPSGFTLDAFILPSGLPDYSYLEYSVPSGTLFLNTPISLPDINSSDALSVRPGLDDSLASLNFDQGMATSGNVGTTQIVVSGVLDNTVNGITDAYGISTTLEGGSQLQEQPQINLSGTLSVSPEIYFASVDSNDSGVHASEIISISPTLENSSYQTILLDEASISGNLLFTSDIQAASSIDIEISLASGRGAADVLLFDYSLIGQTDEVFLGSASLYEEVLDPPIRLHISDIISGVTSVYAGISLPLEQSANNESLFGDSASNIGFSVFNTTVSGQVVDVIRNEDFIDAYSNISLRFNIPLFSYGGFLETKEQPLEAYAEPVLRQQPRLDGFARFTIDQDNLRRKPWNAKTLPIEGKLLRILSQPGETLRLDVVQQYFVQPLGVTKRNGDFLVSDFPEGAIWNIDRFSGRTTDYIYRVGPPLDIVEHNGVTYFTSIVDQGSVWVTNGKLTGIYLQDLGFLPSSIKSYRGRLYINQPEIGRIWDITSPTNIFTVVTVPATLAYDFKFLGDKMYILDGVSTDRYLQSFGDDLNSVLYSYNLVTGQVIVEFFGSLRTPGNQSAGYSILAFEPVENGFYYSDLGNIEMLSRINIWRPGCIGFLNYESGTRTLVVKAQSITDFNTTERDINDFLPDIQDILSRENLSESEILNEVVNFVTNFNSNIRDPKIVLPFKLLNDNGVIHFIDMGIGYSATEEIIDSNGLGFPLSGNRLNGFGQGLDSLLGGLGANMLRQLLNEGGGSIALGDEVNSNFETEDGFIRETEEQFTLDELLAQRYPWLGFENVDLLLDVFSLSLYFKISLSEDGLPSFSDAKGLGLEDFEEEFGGIGQGGEAPPAPIKIVDLYIDRTEILYEFEDPDPDLEGDALPFPNFFFQISFGDGAPRIGEGDEVPDIRIPLPKGGGGLGLLRDPGGRIVFNIILSVTRMVNFIRNPILLSRRNRRRNRPWNFTSSSAIDRTGKGVYMYQTPPFKKTSIRSLSVCLFDNAINVDRFFSVVVVPSDFFAPPPTNASVAEIREIYPDDLASEPPENLRYLIKNKRISPGETFVLSYLGVLKDLERVYVVSNEGLWMSFDMTFEEFPDFYSQKIIDFAEQAGIFNSQVLYTLDSSNSYRAT